LSSHNLLLLLKSILLYFLGIISDDYSSSCCVTGHQCECTWLFDPRTHIRSCVCATQTCTEWHHSHVLSCELWFVWSSLLPSVPPGPVMLLLPPPLSHHYSLLCYFMGGQCRVRVRVHWLRVACSASAAFEGSYHLRVCTCARLYFWFLGFPYLSMYSSTKAFQSILGRVLHFELQSHNIDVCTAIVGPVHTAGFHEFFDQGMPVLRPRLFFSSLLDCLWCVLYTCWGVGVRGKVDGREQ
jgi:hypothetical protein